MLEEWCSICSRPFSTGSRWHYFWKRVESWRGTQGAVAVQQTSRPALDPGGHVPGNSWKG